MTGSAFTNGRPPDACGCCEDARAPVPRPRYNPPGLSRLALRIGTHGDFKAAMLARLGRTGALRRLSVREDSDPTIALLDGWASVLDILTFYQEEIGNEGYLRTAEERFSVQQLAGGIGYRLLPGVGSSTYLAFECEATPATPVEITIPAATQVQSTPAPGETAQIFETKEQIVGRPDWNALRPRLTAPVKLKQGRRTIYLAGTTTGLEPGMPLVFLPEGAEDDPAASNANLRWIESIDTFEPPRRDDPRPPHTKIRLDRGIQKVKAKDNARIMTFRQRGAAFGHNAIRWADLPLPLRVGELHPESGDFIPGPYAHRQGSWADSRFSDKTTLLYLDQVYQRLVKGGWIAMTGKSGAAIYQITEVKQRSRTDFLISAKVSRLRIEGSGIGAFSPRTMTVWCESEFLEPAEKPLTDHVSGNSVVLNGRYDALAKDRWLAVSGLSSIDESEASEVVRIKAVEQISDGRTQLRFATNLQHSYQRLSVQMNANVAEADLGVTRGEVLGDGDASVPFQRFVLQSNPLTYVSSTSPRGVDTTLEVRVDGQRWQEVETFHGREADERIYTVRHREDGSAAVTFGDGVRSGARPASGASNVTASLRVGIGTDGNLPVGRIDQLLTRPLGVKAVTNPSPAEGAADPEQITDARRNAATQVRMVDRIVSLRDYQDFASSFAGIEKAQAQAIWVDNRKLVHVTIAGAEGATVPPGTKLYDNLRTAMDLARHALEPVELATYAPRLFTLKADLKIAPDLLIDDVTSAARAAVISAFSFAERGFGQAVTKGEVAAALHGVEGVRGVIITALAFENDGDVVRDVLPAHLARVEDGALRLAELLLVEETGLELNGAF